MNVEKLALAYCRGIDDLTELVNDIDKAREPVRAELDEIERSPQEERYKTVTRYHELRKQLRNMTHTRMEIVHVRAALRVRRDELDPDLIARMASAARSAALRSAARPTSREQESEA